MNALRSRLILTPVFAIALFMMCTTSLAQGTSTGPISDGSTGVSNGIVIRFGSNTNPFPIDLDPAGSPWTKNIFDPLNFVDASHALILTEVIQNVGTEPWFDWHEHILPDPDHTSVVWNAVGMKINGSPITFNTIGLNTPDLWLDTFSQPVLPGDVLQIDKGITVIPAAGSVPGTRVVTIEEYPTPEPASAALIGISSVLILGKRRAVG